VTATPTLSRGQGKSRRSREPARSSEVGSAICTAAPQVRNGHYSELSPRGHRRVSRRRVSILSQIEPVVLTRSSLSDAIPQGTASHGGDPQRGYGNHGSLAFLCAYPIAFCGGSGTLTACSDGAGVFPFGSGIFVFSWCQRRQQGHRANFITLCHADGMTKLTEHGRRHVSRLRSPRDDVGERPGKRLSGDVAGHAADGSDIVICLRGDSQSRGLGPCRRAVT